MRSERSNPECNHAVYQFAIGADPSGFKFDTETISTLVDGKRPGTGTLDALRAVGDRATVLVWSDAPEWLERGQVYELESGTLRQRTTA